MFRRNDFSTEGLIVSHTAKYLPVLSKLKLFIALSRTPHGLLDLATPGFAALLWLGTFPPMKTIVLGLITAFAGYTTVYALNDVVDHRADQEKLRLGGFGESGHDLDVTGVRHPIARNMLSFREGLLWVLAWAVLAFGGAYALNPVCALIFVMGCLLEGVYCMLLRVTHLRTLVSGAVKTSGGMAAAYAVDPSPSSTFLVILFLWIFFWEIGGQNVPNDWADMEEDARLGAKTVPVQIGPESSRVLILGSLLVATAANLLLLHAVPYKIGLPWLTVSLLMSVYFLLLPGYRLYKTRQRQDAAALFNRASYYPLALLIVIGVRSFT
jgi:4-hydroxybenzoate polyprenyltransferase